MEHIKEIQNAPKPVGPYSIAVKANGFVFLSGQVAIDPVTSKLIEGDVAAQIEQVLKNLKAVLHESGSSYEKVVMTTIFLARMEDFKIVNEVYAKFVSSANPPARQTVAVKELPLGALVEISLIAVG
ncbi:MAG: Rid family detoxifying hydrolase [Proteobacteria bacterium]|nr:Rid family detoxifying hydrolase [Pseudomonadota bacterium]